MNLRRIKEDTYNIGIIYKSVDEIIGGIPKDSIIWLKHNYHDRFFADPFLWRQDGTYYYILAEEYVFWQRTGRIVLLTVSKQDFALHQRVVLIEEKWHLSYPFCEENGTTIVTEAYQSGYCYRYDTSPSGNQIVERVKICDEPLIDATFLYNNQENWAFAATTDCPTEKLFLFKQEADGNFYNINKLPIKVDNKTSRSAGRVFAWHDKLVRPVQDCEIKYGKQVKLMEIKEIHENAFVEIEITALNSNLNPPFDEGFHTFNVYDGFIIIDGYKDFRQYMRQYLYKKIWKTLRFLKFFNKWQ